MCMPLLMKPPCFWHPGIPRYSSLVWLVCPVLITNRFLQQGYPDQTNGHRLVIRKHYRCLLPPSLLLGGGFDIASTSALMSETFSPWTLIKSQWRVPPAIRTLWVFIFPALYRALTNRMLRGESGLGSRDVTFSLPTFIAVPCRNRSKQIYV